MMKSGASGSTNEAADYVESIMSTQHAVRVNTPMSRRKRNRSAPSPTTTVKKARNTDVSPLASRSEDEASPHQGAGTRRVLYSDTPTPAQKRKRCMSNGKSVSHVSMETLIDRLSVDISNRFSELNDRIDRLEQGLEQKIANKVGQMLDKRINSEMKRMRKDVDAHIENVTDSIKAEVAADIADVTKRIDSLGPVLSPDISCNIVVRNLPEHQNENISEKVTTLIREGCGVRDVPIVSAERKKGPYGKAGVVIVKLRSGEDKKQIMQNKRKLQHNRKFKNVFIHHDQSRTDRLIADNFRAILSAIRSGDHDIVVRGSRVVKSDSRHSSETRHGGSDRESHRHSGRQNHNSRHNSHHDNHNRQYQNRR